MCARTNDQCTRQAVPDGGRCTAESDCCAKEAYADAITPDEEEFDELTTTGVISIMKANGRKEVAELVEELHDATKTVSQTQAKAEKLLLALRQLQRQRTGHYAKVAPTSKTEKENQ